MQLENRNKFQAWQDQKINKKSETRVSNIE